MKAWPLATEYIQMRKCKANPIIRNTDELQGKEQKVDRQAVRITVTMALTAAATDCLDSLGVLAQWFSTYGS